MLPDFKGETLKIEAELELRPENSENRYRILEKVLTGIKNTGLDIFTHDGIRFSGKKSDVLNAVSGLIDRTYEDEVSISAVILKSRKM